MVRSAHVFSLFATVSIAFAAGRESPSGETKSYKLNQIPGAYIVEFEEGQDNNAFRVQAEPEYDTRLNLDYGLFKGVSIQLKDVESAEERARQLADLPAVKNIWPVKIIDRPDPQWHEHGRTFTDAPSRTKRNQPSSHGHLNKRQSNVTDAYSTHVMTQIDKLHAEGITGSGVKIAIIDSGVDYNHPALGGCFGEGCLIANGHDFVGDQYSGGNVPVPDDDPMDCNGHGTHVAGIIAAQSNPLGIIGAAPDASLAAYRVFGCYGGVGNDVLIAAFNQAYEEGADIISASVGGPSGWSGEPWAVAVSRIVEKGVPCILAAGNSGTYGIFDASTAANGKGVTAVASFDNTMQPLSLLESFYTVNNGTRTSFPYDWCGPTWDDRTIRSVWVNSFDLNNTADACEPLPDDTPDLSEYNVVLRQARDCDVATQARNVADKGAQWLTVYNNQSLVEYFEVFDVEEIKGAIAIPRGVGEAWVKAVEDGSDVHTEIIYMYDAATIIFNQPNVDAPGAVSFFSSQGPTFEMDAKPQFGAPGGYIVSTLPLDQGAYGVASGTSMACPMVAAAFALIIQARGSLEPATIENLLASNANPQLYNEFNEFFDFLGSPVQQGAGLIQVYDAVHATTLLEPSSLSFNDTDNFVETLDFTLSNTDAEEITYDISHVPTNTLYSLLEDGSPGYMPNPSTAVHAELEFSQSKVTLSPGESATIQVTATPPRGINDAQYPLWSGYIAVNCSDGTSLSLLYQGLTGSLYDAEVIDDSEMGVFVAESTAYDILPVPKNFTFTLPAPGTPWEEVDPYEIPLPVLVIDQYWGSAKLFADIVRLNSCVPNSTLNARGDKVVGQMAGFPMEWTPRNWWSFVWLGDLENGEYTPVGRYKIVVRALRIFGDESKDDDWVIRESNSFGIRYSKPSE